MLSWETRFEAQRKMARFWNFEFHCKLNVPPSTPRKLKVELAICREVDIGIDDSRSSWNESRDSPLLVGLIIEV